MVEVKVCFIRLSQQKTEKTQRVSKNQNKTKQNKTKQKKLSF